jgi:serine/threonine protein kinase
MNIKMQEDQIINTRYKILSELGKGGFGQVYKVQDLQKQSEYALKIDLTHQGSVLQEVKVLQDLQGGEGISKLYDNGKFNNRAFMVLELLGANLSSMRKSLNGFSLNTVVLILFETLERIRFVHSKGYIHRDVKPQQFLIGPKDVIYLVDFGISKKFMIDGHHIAFQSQCERAGSSSYASINSHIGIRLSRRDDLESWVYMAVYLIQGYLPWQQGKTLNNNRKWQTVFTLKRSTPDEDLFCKCPKQFHSILNYIRTVKFEEKPNYQYLKDLLTTINTEFSLQCRNFDWVMLERHQLELEKRKKEANKRKTSKKRVRNNRRNQTMNNMVSINHFGGADTKSFLQIPVGLSRTASRNSQDLDSSDCETIKNTFPEFNNREKVFQQLKAFRAGLTYK